MKMFKYFVLMGAMALSTQACAVDRVYIPQKDIVGSHIDNQLHLLSTDNSSQRTIYPIGVSIDVDAGKITGVVFHYEKSVAIHLIESEVNNTFSEWKVKPSTNNDVGVRLWRVEPMRFTIQLSTDNDGNPKLVYLGWIK